MGKSSIAIGVSTSLSRMGKKTLLVDGDSHVKSVELKLLRRYRHTLRDIMAGRRGWEVCVYQSDLMSLTPSTMSRKGGGGPDP